MVREVLYLVLEVVPPVRPRLFDAPLLLENSTRDDSSQDAECHSHAVIVVTVDTNVLLVFGNRLSDDFQTIVELVRCDAKLGCKRIKSPYENKFAVETHQVHQSWHEFDCTL